jgi:hypothetical protein
MNELIEFAARLIELEGGAVESHPSGIVALLPARLSSAWSTGEELQLSATSEGPDRFSYGTELLERMIHSATQTVPVACVRLDAVPARASQVRSAATHWQLRNGVVEVGEIRIGPQIRLWVDALATLHGDEKRELMVSAVMSPHSATHVDGFAEAAFGLDLTEQAADASSSPLALISLLDKALGACARHAEQSANSFRESMTRRFDRDRLRIEGYFDDLLGELDKRAAKGRLDPAAVADKRRAIHADRSAKLDALSARFVLRIEVLPIALRSIELDGGFVALTLRRRKATRVIELEYDAATRKLVPPACEACGGAAQKPAACDDAVHLLCEACVPRADGRIACPRCRTGTKSKLLQASTLEPGAG